MTLRQLIEEGANLDDEIMVEVWAYDKDGKSIGTFSTFAAVDYNETRVEADEIIIRSKVYPI